MTCLIAEHQEKQEFGAKEVKLSHTMTKTQFFSHKMEN